MSSSFIISSAILNVRLHTCEGGGYVANNLSIHEVLRRAVMAEEHGEYVPLMTKISHVLDGPGVSA